METNSGSSYYRCYPQETRDVSRVCVENLLMEHGYGFTKEERDLVNRATKIDSYENLLISGLIWAAKKTITQHKTLKEIDLDSDKTKKSTSKGLGRLRVLAAIEKIHEYNNSCQRTADKWCITKGTIFKATGTNKQTIASLVDLDTEINSKIKKYNSVHGLEEWHNRKGKFYTFPVTI